MKTQLKRSSKISKSKKKILKRKNPKENPLLEKLINGDYNPNNIKEEEYGPYFHGIHDLDITHVFVKDDKIYLSMDS